MRNKIFLTWGFLSGKDTRGVEFNNVSPSRPEKFRGDVAFMRLVSQRSLATLKRDSIARTGHRYIEEKKFRPCSIESATIRMRNKHVLITMKLQRFALACKLGSSFDQISRLIN